MELLSTVRIEWQVCMRASASEVKSNRSLGGRPTQLRTPLIADFAMSGFFAQAAVQFLRNPRSGTHLEARDKTFPQAYSRVAFR